MNKKGLTVVELIVSFSLTMAIVIFLIQIIINLTNIYGSNGKKTEILNKQSIISNTINTTFMEKGLTSIDNCGDNCYNFYYQNGESTKLSLNGNILTFGSLVTELNNATFEDLKLDVVYSPTIQNSVDNAIFILNIPITSDIDYNFDIRIVYQFNLDNSLIDEYFSS